MLVDIYVRAKRWLLVLSSINLLLALAVVPLFSLAIGWAKLSVLDKYWELYNEKIIDSRIVERVHNGRFAGDWAKIPYYLMEKFDLVKSVAWFLAAVHFAVSILVLGIWRQMCKDNGSRLYMSHDEGAVIQVHKEQGTKPQAEPPGQHREGP